MVWLWAAGFIVVLFGFVVFRGAPYVPSRKRELERAFTELYPISSKDVLVDIGSGDGVVLRQAAKYGARAVGYELNPALVLISRILSRKQVGRVQTILVDFWRVQLPDDVTIVYMFTESRDVRRMVKKVATEASRLERPIMLISYGISVPDYTPVSEVGAYFLYEVTPLQMRQA